MSSTIQSTMENLQEDNGAQDAKCQKDHRIELEWKKAS